MDSMSQLLDEITVVHKRRNLENKVSSSTDPKFGIFDFFDVGEAVLSNIFRWLLDPCGSHGQGSIFLKHFLEIVTQKSEGRFVFDEDGISSVKVVIEDRLEGNRPIDIVLSHANFLIGIENKAGADDQPKQVKEYLETIKKSGARRNFKCLIYLNPTGYLPSPKSIEQAECAIERRIGHLQIWSYKEDLLLWLNHCAAASNAASLKTFIIHIDKHVKKVVLGDVDMAEFEEIFRLIENNESRIWASMTIVANQKRIMQRLWEDFSKKFYDEVKRSKEWDECKPQPQGWPYAQIKIKNICASEGLKSEVCFVIQFSNDEFSGLEYGISVVPLIDQSYCNTADSPKLTRVKNGDREFFRHNWAEISEPWVEMTNGTMTTKIFNFANQAIANQFTSQNMPA